MNINRICRRLSAATAILLGGVTANAATAVNTGDPSLSALEIKVDGQNIVKFDRNTTNYSIELDDPSLMTLSAAPSASDAIVTITVNGREYDNHSLASLDGGENTIVYNIVSGSASRSYTINVKTPQVLRGRHFSWKNATIYFVLTDRFNNGDTTNDNSYHRQRPQGSVPDYATFHGGDIKGLTEKLDYLNRLGVDAIWISAPYEQMHGWTGGQNDAFPHYAFHGYYALDWTYMDRNMGTVEEFRTFVTEAHKRGIRVVMDIVMNHTGYCTLDDCVDYDFGNFNGTPTAGWMPSNGKYTMWSDDNAVSFNADTQGKWGNWWAGWVRAFGDRSWAQAAGFTPEGGDNYTMSLAGLPDVVTEKTSSVNIPPFLKMKWQQENSGDYLDYRLPNLDAWRADGKGAPADYLVAWLAGWVEEFGIDGFRCDTAKHVELSRWNQLKQACKSALNSWRSSSRADEYAKGWTDDFWMTGEAFGWDHGDTGYFTSGGFDSMINFAFNSSEGSQGRTPSVSDWEYYANYCNGSNGRQVLNYVSSHDTGLHRPGDQKKVATMLLLCPGGAQIYYGDETSRGYMSGCPDQSMATRSDFNWSAVDNDDNKHWQRIGQFRRRNPAVGAGTQTNLGGDTYGRRFTDGEYSNAAVIRLNTTAGQTYTVSVNGFFADGAKVMDGYNTATTATVSGGKVTMQASGPVLLVEAYGQITDEEVNTPTPPVPPVPQKPVVTATPGSSVFNGSVTVALSVNPAGTPIRYSLTGAANASSTVYSSPLTFTETTTLSTYVENEGGSNVQTFSYTLQGEEPDPGPDPDKQYIYFNNTQNWTPYVWAWNDAENCTVSGNWPGDKMTVKDGKYYWEAPAGKVPTQIIISDNGGTKAGGGDLNYVNGATYNADGTTGDSPTPPVPSGDSVVYFDNSATNWSTVKVHYWGGTSATSWPGKDMEAVTDSIYKCTVADGTTGLVFNNGAGDQSVNLTFVKGHLYDKNSDKGEYK
ncbi:MAG: starch-binding protein [Muribaculaceae bacterium]|nr:starch-binding protein [Muribaculaceae bacterium]